MLLLLVHNSQLIFILTISWMELQQFSSSVMGSEKQLEFPLQVFCLARKLLIVFKILAGHFPTQLEQFSLLILESTRLFRKQWSKQGSFINSPEAIHGPTEGQKPRLSASTGWEKSPGDLWRHLISSVLLKATLCYPICAISAPKRR